MITYGDWKDKTFLVTNLELDPRNPRVPRSQAEISQRDIVADLVEHDKVIEIARSIADHGYFPVEAIIVVTEDGHRYVVEGNRRVAALKLLLSPGFAPEDWQPRFRALSNRVDPKVLKKIKAVCAPTREAAAPVIMSRHTQRQIEGWSPLMQARFYRNLVASHVSVQDIADQYHIPASDITDALKMGLMYEIACTLDLPADVAAKVRNPREFPVTTLERLYKYPKALEFLGIQFDDQKGLVGRVHADEFRKGYGRIITDIARGRAGSRHLNTIGDMQKYLASLGDDTPDLSKRGRLTAQSLLGSAQPIGAAPRERPGAKKKTRPAPKPLALIPPAFTCEVNNQRINDFFEELKRLRVAQFPNAVGIMLRSLVEMSLSYYLDRTGRLQTLVQKFQEQRAKKGGARPRGWHPTLKQMLAYVVQDSVGIVSNPNLLRGLNKLLSDSDSLLSVDSLDLYVHNPYVCPDEATLRRFWVQLEGLLQITLVEPGP